MADKYLRQSLIPAAATETAIYTVPAANSDDTVTARD